VVDAHVEVRGIAELKRAFDATADDIPEAVRKAEGETVSSIVSEASGLYPHITGRTAAELVAHGSTIVYGGIASQVVDFRGVRGGRYVYPTIERHAQRIEEAAGDGALEAARAHGFEVSR
jgi:hypothetical protein